MTKIKIPNKTIKQWQGIFSVVAIGLMAGLLIAAPLVRADTYDEQIKAIRAQNAGVQANKDQLGAEAASLADKVNKLQTEINALQAQIVANQQKRDETIAKIKQAEEDLAKQKKLLGENIKAMYLEGQISTLEQLASSKDLSEFVDKEQYRNSVKNKIKAAVDQINLLKAQLADQKAQLEKLIADQQAIQSQLAVQQAEQNRLLSLNQAQQAELDSQIKANNSRIMELKKQQAAENARRFGSIPQGIPGGGGYPGYWAFAPQDSMVDSWGMYNRECVSYAAWKVAVSGRYMPYWGGIGNANQWPGNARASGIPVDGNPRVGDIAIGMYGYYGHAMYVEYVYGDGTIFVSQYNFGLDGNYSEMRVSASGLYFIHF